MHVKTIRGCPIRLVTGLSMAVSLSLLLSAQRISAEENNAPSEEKNGAAEESKEHAEEQKGPVAGKDCPPDYTKGEEQSHCEFPWALGATGAFGDIWYREPRMIQVVSVEKGTPADGKLKQLDVILGVGSSTHFISDARKVLSAAITEAEKSNGKLVLNIWRPVTTRVDVPAEDGKGSTTKLVMAKPVSGETLQVTLELPVKGAFSATAPWECEKTKALINDAAQAIAKRELKVDDIADNLDALGLLATGDAKYLPLVATLAQKQAKACEAYDIMDDKGVTSWAGGYMNLFMTEYYLMTKDETVLPGIKALSTYLAYGQDGVGTWSHVMASVKANGLYGPPAAYGSMNQCSLVCAISLVLAQKCGITTKPINDAVNRSRVFYRFYVDKGTIPYGDHAPALCHDNNGRNSIAAVFFDLLGDKEATKYFTLMTLASYTLREGGHTGHWFAWQWGALGASRGGPTAASAFVEKTLWFTELERRADGSSEYQAQLKGDHKKYIGWSTTGQRLMQHCLPRKVLAITGKGDSCMPPLTRDEVTDAVDAATFNPKGLPVKELLAKLGSWSLVVRQSASEELGTREDNIVEELIAMLDSPNRYARYGAATGLRYCGRKSEKAVDKLVDKVENDKDMTLRYFAVNALTLPREDKNNRSPTILGSATRKAVPALLKLAAAYDPEQDATRKLSGQIATMMMYGGRVGDCAGFFPNGKGSDKVDRELLIPAIKAWLQNPNGGARSVASTVYPHLSEKDLESLWADIYIAAKYPSPSGVMFSGGVMANGAQLLAQYRFEEGLPLALDYLYKNGWGKCGRVPAALNALAPYGSALKPYLEEMRTREYEPYVKNRKPREVKDCKAAWQKVLDNIDKDVQLRSIAPYLKGANIKPPEKVFPPKK